jgi:hypothetical protein
MIDDHIKYSDQHYNDLHLLYLLQPTGKRPQDICGIRSTIIGQVDIEILSSMLHESTTLKLPHSLYFLNAPGCKCYF